MYSVEREAKKSSTLKGYSDGWMDRFVSCCFPAETWHRAAPKEKSEGSAAEGAEEGGDMKNPRELCVFFRLDKKKLSTAGVAMNGPGDKNKWVRGRQKRQTQIWECKSVDTISP